MIAHLWINVNRNINSIKKLFYSICDINNQNATYVNRKKTARREPTRCFVIVKFFLEIG